MRHVIHHYTKEAGVRNLEREIATICRKIAKEVVQHGQGRRRSTASRPRTWPSTSASRSTATRKKEEQDEIGLANGLAVTMFGGDLLATEVTVDAGQGQADPHRQARRRHAGDRRRRR